MSYSERNLYIENLNLYNGLNLLRNSVFVDSDVWYLMRNELGANGGVCELDANGYVPVNRLPINVMTFEGSWNASMNYPYLVNGMTSYNVGALFICIVSGSVDFGDGVIEFMSGDYVVYNNSLKWERIEGSRSLNNRHYHCGISLNGHGNALLVGDMGETLGISGKLLGIDILCDVSCNMVLRFMKNGVEYGFSPISISGVRQLSMMLSNPDIISDSDIMGIEVLNNDVCSWLLFRLRILKDV